MNEIFEVVKYILPSIVVAAVSMYFLKAFFEEQKIKRYHEEKMSTKKESLPIRLQAYERLSLLLERITLVSLARRVPANINSTELYKHVLIKQVNDEYDHNVSQQIYVTPTLWKLINTAKNATIVIINQTHSNLEEGASINDFMNLLISADSNEDNPIKLAMGFLKEEISKEI